MTPLRRRLARLVFWVLFLTAAGVTARQIWKKLDPLHNHPWLATWWLEYQHGRLASSDPAVGAEAWRELELAFLTKWSAYDWIVWRVKEDIWRQQDPPIHFALQREGSRYRPYAGPPTRECRTVTEALLALLYQEPGWKTDFQGNWRKWWDANWTYYPNRHLPGKPSGPEDPGGRRRR